MRHLSHLFNRTLVSINVRTMKLTAVAIPFMSELKLAEVGLELGILSVAVSSIRIFED